MMDFLDKILLGVAGGIATGVGQHLYDQLKNYLNEFFKDKREHKITKALEEIGNLADGDIRRRVEEFARLKKLTAGQAEELTGLLVNLAHGARFHTTHGSARSSFVRCERLLDQLLGSVLPKRRKGDTVADNGMPGWRLTRFLGMGSFGEVWQAESAEYPEPRAIKLFTSADAVQWIRAEQTTLFKVRAELPKHPNLIGFLDVALSGKPFPYLVLEYASGGSLEEWILSHEQEQPALDKQEMMAGIIRGLAEAHEHGISHRDLKPANILLSAEDDPVPKIADFGLGRVDTRRADASSQASQATVVGTTMYLPPEALQQFAKRSPFQDDVFAIGVIWYQLLVGKLERPPYDFADRLREHLVDLQTIRVIERCLAHPARRYQDGSDLAQAVEAMDRIPDWPVPPDCFDVQDLGRAYLTSKP
jgi:serine/threonine protein kinase